MFPWAQLALLARLGYYLLTTFSGAKTLGEEHTRLLRVLFVPTVVPGAVAVVHAATYLGWGRRCVCVFSHVLWWCWRGPMA